MCNKDIEGQKFVCVGVKFLAYNVLLNTMFEQKVIGDNCDIPIAFNNPLKASFFNKKYPIKSKQAHKL